MKLHNKPLLLHKVIEEAALKFPNKIAIKFKLQSITYKELDEQSSKIAIYLQRKGFQKQDRAIINSRKDIRTVVSIYGVLKAGGVYVPVDFKEPQLRLKYIVDKSGAQFIITDEIVFKKYSEDLIRGCKQIILTNDSNDTIKKTANISFWDQIMSFHQKPYKPAEINEQDLCYLIFTSGSSGLPKGVAIRHLSAMTFINFIVKAFKVKADDQISNHSSFAFDISVFDIFATARSAATLHVTPEEILMFPSLVAKWIHDNKITICFSATYFWVYLITKVNTAQINFPGLKYVLFAGEVFPFKYLYQLQKALPNVRLFNLYGPTECTVVVTSYEIPRLKNGHTRPVPIGTPFRYVKAFVLDSEGDQIFTKRGQQGELLLHGNMIFKEYWNEPEKTSAAFVRIKRGNKEILCYKTGDIVKIVGKNLYQFINRKDQMIKSHGFRVELGEIESTLYQHKYIKEAVVLSIPNEIIGNKLIAVVKVTQKSKDLSKELQQFCSKRLPSYMIPQIKIVNQIPKNSNLKPDRKKLSALIKTITN